MSEVVENLKNIWRRFRQSRWYRISELAVLSACFALMLYVLTKNFSKIDLSSFHFDTISLLIAVVFTLIAVWLGALSWAQILRAIQPQFSYSASIRSHMLSIPTKYLPGLGWQQVSKVIQIRKERGSLQTTTSAVIVEFVLVISTGLATATAIVLATQQEVFGFILPVAWSIGFEILFLATCFAIPICWALFQLRQLNFKLNLVSYSCRMIATMLIQVIGWIFFGTALWFVCYSIYPIGIEILPHFTTSLILSVVIGILVIVSPNGLGVRELIMVAFLQRYVPVQIALAVSVMSRFVLVLAEILGALPFIIERYVHNIKAKAN